MDAKAITDLVEDYWRGAIPVMQHSGPTAFKAMGARFEERIQQIAALMPSYEAAVFKLAVDAERERLMAEYTENPAGLKRRLGIALGVDDYRKR